MKHEPVVKENRGISVVWILPLVALCICSWLLYSGYKNAGEEITIYFGDASGIVPGKTQVMARGIPVGLVKDIIPDLANNRIKTIVNIEREVTDQLVEDTIFWVVRAELSASSIRGLDTILSGSYIGIQPGVSSLHEKEFKGRTSPPPVAADTPGLHIKLRAELLGSIQAGSGIFYRNIKIGMVQKHQLEGDSSILIDLFIEPAFAHLVREGSRFCNASGIQISGKLPNVKIQVESLASLIRGGILLYTPEELKSTAQAENGGVYTLYPDYEAADYGIPMILRLASGEGLVEGGTRVMYRGLEAGIVKDIQLAENEGKPEITAHILLDPRAEVILREGTRFWLEEADISVAGVQNLQLFLSGAYITFLPGGGDFLDQFELLHEPPAQPPLRPGTSFTLLSSEANRVKVGGPVYFKNIKVGEVIEIDLTRSATTIRTTIFIYEEYLHLLSKKSVFWVFSGLELQADLASGIDVSISPLEKVLGGGISFTTPDKLQKIKNYSPEDGFTFKFYQSYQEAVEMTPSMQRSGKKIQIVAQEPDSLSVGSPILYKNISIGEIESLQLSDDSESVLIHCLIEKQYAHLIDKRTRFYPMSGLKLSGSLKGIELQSGSLKSMFAGGIACLQEDGDSGLLKAGRYPLYESREAALLGEALEISIAVSSGQKLKEDTPVRYMGIDIGRVRNLAFGKGLSEVAATIVINREKAGLFRQGTRVWVERPELSLNGFKNVETLLFGSYLNIMPGDGPLKRDFTVLDEAPLAEIAGRDGLGIVLYGAHLGSLTRGSPVYYRQVQVGQVTGYELSPTFQKVHIHIVIEERYRSLIRRNSRFWNVSGARFEGGLFSGLKVTTDSLTSILSGGVALATPDDGEKQAPAEPGDHFRLHDKAGKEWLDWSPDIVLLQLEDSKKMLEYQED